MRFDVPALQGSDAVAQIAQTLQIDTDCVLGKLCAFVAWVRRNRYEASAPFNTAVIDTAVRKAGFSAALLACRWFTPATEDGWVTAENFGSDPATEARLRTERRSKATSRMREHRERHRGDTPSVTVTKARHKSDGVSVTPAQVVEKKKKKRGTRSATRRAAVAFEVAVEGAVEVAVEKKPIASAAKTMPALPDWIPSDAWEAWVELRRRMRAPLTARAAELALQGLSQLRDQGESPRAVLEQSILRGWRGLFAVHRDAGKGNGAIDFSKSDYQSGATDAADISWLDGGDEKV
jgi:hypothetical protein